MRQAFIISALPLCKSARLKGLPMNFCRMLSALCFLLIPFAMNGQQSEQPASAGADQTAETNFRQLADRYFDEAYFKFNPTAGTSAGFHQYDTLLEDFSKKAIAARGAALHRYQAIFEQVDASKLAPTSQ